jgi:hypothetical protein
MTVLLEKKDRALALLQFAYVGFFAVVVQEVLSLIFLNKVLIVLITIRRSN